MSLMSNAHMRQFFSWYLAGGVVVYLIYVMWNSKLGRGITVNAVAPGIINSGMAEGTFDKALIERLVPMKRSGRADEVAALVAFLASDEAGYISGQVISINGAMI